MLTALLTLVLAVAGERVFTTPALPPMEVSPDPSPAPPPIPEK